MIGVARPTRGLEFAESAQSIEKNLVSFRHVIERTWDQPIPDSFNYLTRLLLGSSFLLTHIWFVEEDVVVPKGALEALYHLNVDIAAVRYPLKVDGRVSEELDDQGSILWQSLGCTLVRRHVFERLAEPWFKSGYVIASIHDGSSSTRRRYELVPGGKDYGNHDAYLCWNAREAGFTIGAAEGFLAGHLIVEGYGEPGKNKGCHRIGRSQLRPRGSNAV